MLISKGKFANPHACGLNNLYLIIIKRIKRIGFVPYVVGIFTETPLLFQVFNPQSTT